MVFVLRQLQEKFREQNKGLCVTLVDLTKAFDPVSRKGRWQILEHLGCPLKFLKMIISLHEDQRGQVRHGDVLSEPFPVANGVNQGCVLAPTLFTIFFSMMLQRATADLDFENGVYIRYRTDGSLFNLRRVKVHTKTLNHLVHELLYADDAALVAHTEAALQRLTSCFAEAAELFGLEVSLKKTEVFYQPAPQEVFHHPHITIGETALKSVQQFNYLGSIISSDGKIDAKIDNRLAKAYRAFGKLRKRVWQNKHLKKSTKISIYRAIVLSTLFYGSEPWVIYRHHLRLLERFHQRCLRTILNIHWTDYVSNTSVLEQAAVTSTEALLLRTQLCWAGHVSRMQDHCHPKIVLCGELATGCSERGAPKRRNKECLKQSLSLGHVDHHHWSTLASSREAWRHTIYNAAAAFENTRRITLEEKRQHRKNHIFSISPGESFCCAFCNQTCLSPIGLFNHFLTHFVASVGRALLKSSFVKPSHDDDNDELQKAHQVRFWHASIDDSNGFLLLQ